jgi:hypothetical protein
MGAKLLVYMLISHLERPQSSKRYIQKQITYLYSNLFIIHAGRYMQMEALS